jgi:hypothetical protein
MKDEEQIRRVIALQKEIEDHKREVSKLLDGVMKGNKEMTLGSRIVLDGVLWEITRWPYAGAPRKDDFFAWKLSNKGKVVQ